MSGKLGTIRSKAGRCEEFFPYEVMDFGSNEAGERVAKHTTPI